MKTLYTTTCITKEGNYRVIGGLSAKEAQNELEYERKQGSTNIKLISNASTINFCRDCKGPFSNDGQLSYKCTDEKYICETCYTGALPF